MEVLYCDSFVHEKAGDYVDEVSFPQSNFSVSRNLMSSNTGLQGRALQLI
jgi:hypothetical protein